MRKRTTPEAIIELKTFQQKIFVHLGLGERVKIPTQATEVELQKELFLNEVAPVWKAGSGSRRIRLSAL